MDKVRLVKASAGPCSQTAEVGADPAERLDKFLSSEMVKDLTSREGTVFRSLEDQ